MTIPPFPSQDLAKLVLGYLAEEELMTAYDEFLQTSPYLDVLNNEYDWLLMTSLKRMLAEYRAVKIYVNNCKPILRKKLFQCANLVEVVKYLVNHIDLNKLHGQEANADNLGLEKQNTSATSKPPECEVCTSFKPVGSVTNLQTSDSQSTSHAQASSIESSVEATPLADLPGNLVTTRKKNVRVIDKETTSVQSNSSSGQTSDSNAKEQSHSCNEQQISNCNSPTSLKSSDNMTLNSTIKAMDTGESRQKIEEFNNVLNSVVIKNNTVSDIGNPVHRRISAARTFQDFASGVAGIENHNANIPDSSTSENLGSQLPITKEHCTSNFKKCQLTIVGHIKDNTIINPSSDINYMNKSSFSRIKPKTDEQKIKILSDIKVDSKSNNDQKKKNATSTPLMQMQTIVINGTPAYRHNTLGNNHNFTKDEIMAMPTLIVVPAPGSSNHPKSAQSIASQNTNLTTSIASSTARVLGPLIIDVTQSPDPTNKTSAEAATISTLNPQTISENGLVKTVDILRNASLPKDNTVSSVVTNTPHVLPPTRKSSSTPRRSSHIRVLDFTTPRRILHETINEKVGSQNPEIAVENFHSDNPNGQCTGTVYTEKGAVTENNITVCNIDSGSAKENDLINETVSKKKYNWDADLRALAVANALDDKPSKVISKSNNSRSKNSNLKSYDKVDGKKSRSNKKISPRIKKSKKKKKIEDEDEPLPALGKKVDVPVKPTINIVSGSDRGITSAQEGKKSIENNHKDVGDDNDIETPEVEKIALQNAIGAKLNISDLLETPYKQALYDIQMETPRFIGLPDEPISDIKIMNIPTPRFFATPKHALATPSSSSSRPTDYSSGGSYYKPDDQDYMPIPDLSCPVTSSKEDYIGPLKENNNGCKKTSRPVRQCTKNVSYYNSSGVACKIKEVEDNADIASSCSETLSANSSIDCKNKVFAKAAKLRSKSESRKRSSKTSGKKIKSPIKDKSKSFMKIKPRRPTPTKESMSGRYKKKSFDTTHGSPKLQRRNRTTSKEMSINFTPVVNSAPTKSRRKSSTPRKLHCTKTCNSGSLVHSSPETITDTKASASRDANVICAQDSDTEQLALRWSDDGSQDTKSKETQINTSVNESEDILKIREYIKTTDVNTSTRPASEATLQAHLVKRGFDVETAKIIERDLLDTPPHSEPKTDPSISTVLVEATKDPVPVNNIVEMNNSVTDDLQIIQDELPDDEVELSVYECNEESKNYVEYSYDETKDISRNPPVKLKDKFSMEVCIDEGVAIRLRAGVFSLLFEQDPQVSEVEYDYQETEVAVKSISNIEKLYTPLKDPIKAQCYEIFDSTLTSLDTPLKINSPKRNECENSVTEIVLEVEKVEIKEKTESKKRKRIQSGSDESILEIKKTKPEAQYIFNSANIQNIDIESVLKKLHGP